MSARAIGMLSVVNVVLNVEATGVWERVSMRACDECKRAKKDPIADLRQVKKNLE